MLKPVSHITSRSLRGNWHELRDGHSYTLTRHLPARFDVSACAVFPVLRRGRLARQIRQDMWRMLQDLRGFSPVVQVSSHQDGLLVRAGGRVMGRASGVEARIHDFLNDPNRRARWIVCARKAGQ